MGHPRDGRGARDAVEQMKKSLRWGIVNSGGFRVVSDAFLVLHLLSSLEENNTTQRKSPRLESSELQTRKSEYPAVIGSDSARGSPRHLRTGLTYLTRTILARIQSAIQTIFIKRRCILESTYFLTVFDGILGLIQTGMRIR